MASLPGPAGRRILAGGANHRLEQPTKKPPRQGRRNDPAHPRIPLVPKLHLGTPLSPQLRCSLPRPSGTIESSPALQCRVSHQTSATSQRRPLRKDLFHFSKPEAWQRSSRWSSESASDTTGKLAQDNPIPKGSQPGANPMRFSQRSPAGRLNRPLDPRRHNRSGLGYRIRRAIGKREERPRAMRSGWQRPVNAEQ